MIWQTSPAAFAPTTAWSHVGISSVVNGVLIDVGVAFWDLRAMGLNDPPSLLLDASTEVARWSDAGVEVSGGATITPGPLWIGVRLGARLRSVLYQSLVVSSGVFLETTRGVGEDFPAGWALGLHLGVSWSWPLPIAWVGFDGKSGAVR